MVAVSKLFVPPLNSFHCSQIILHPGIGCFRNFINNLLLYSVSSSKYFSPLLITPLILKYKSMNRELFLHIVKYYLQTVFASSIIGSSTFLFMCLSRAFLGSFRTYTTLFLPAVLSVQLCWFLPKRMLKLFTTATSQAILEGLLFQYSNKYTNLILHSSLVQTILFMLNSAVILHCKREKIYKDFWFIQPNEKFPETGGIKKLNNGEKYYAKYDKNCDHANASCGKFVLDGIMSYSLYGIPLDLLSMFMKGKLIQRNQGLMQKVIGEIKRFRPNMTAFFISYIGIYRLSSCLLRKYYSHLSDDLQHILSAFLGGFSYIFVKRFNLISLSLVLSMQLVWQQFCSSLNSTKSGRRPNVVLLMLKNAPISQIIVPLNCGYLVHNSILNYHLVNNLARGFINGVTHGQMKNIRKTIANNELQYLIEMAERSSIKTFL